MLKLVTAIVILTSGRATKAVRVIGGTKRGERLLTIQDRRIRPMRDQVRTALFNIIRELVPGSRFLDLFAGTGSVGIEALSRGASECTFVDHLPQAVQLIKMNLAKLELLGRAKVYQLDASEAIARFERRGRRFGLIFVGPPYGQGLANETLERLGESQITDRDGLVTVEVFKKERGEMKEKYGRLALIRERKYGDNLILLYRLQ